MVGLSPAVKVIYRDQTSAAGLRDREFSMQIFICPRFHLALPFSRKQCQVPRFVQDFTGTRIRKGNRAERHTTHSEISLRIRSVEFARQRLSLVTLDLARSVVASHQQTLDYLSYFEPAKGGEVGMSSSSDRPIELFSRKAG